MINWRIPPAWNILERFIDGKIIMLNFTKWGISKCFHIYIYLRLYKENCKNPEPFQMVFPDGIFFPTCQVRVVRFYQSACPPPPPPPRLAVLLAVLLASASSTSTSALLHLHFRCPAQCALLDVNLRAAQLSVHRWTSTDR